MTSLPDDFIASFGSDRDLIFFPTKEFLTWAGQEVFKIEDEEGEVIPYYVRKIGSSPELKWLENERHQVMFVGTSSEATSGDDLDSEILEAAKKLTKRSKRREVHVYDRSLSSGELEDPTAFYVTSEFPSVSPRRGFVQKGKGTNAQILGVWTPDGVGPTPGSTKAIADNIFQINSTDTEWFIGFASSPSGLESIESQPNRETAPTFTYWVGESSCFDAAIAGTGGGIMVGRSTGAEWFAIERFGTEVEVGTQVLLTMADYLITDETSTLMSSSTLSVYARFDFNFSAADLVDSEDSNPYDHLFIYRGEGTAVDFVCQLPEPDDARLNPGARVEAIFNVLAMGILEL